MSHDKRDFAHVNKTVDLAPTGVGLLVGRHSAKQKVAGLMPSWGPCPGCRFVWSLVEVYGKGN